MKEIYVGLDPGSRTAGMSALFLEDDVLTRIETMPLDANVLIRGEAHHLLPTAQLDYQIRIERILKLFEYHLNRLQPSCVVIETPFISMGTASAFVPLYFFRLVFDRLMRTKFGHIGIIDKSPMSVKKHLNVSKKSKQSSKDPMADAVKAHPVLGPLLPRPINELSEHEVDAIAIALSGIEVPQ